MKSFLDGLFTLYQQSEETLGGALGKLRESCWRRFLSLELPTKRYHDLYNQSFSLGKRELRAPYEVNPCSLVFINGCYSERYSNREGLSEELVILPLSKALKVFGSFLQARILEESQIENNPFAMLNAALSQEGVFIYLPSHCTVNRPLEIIHILEGEERHLHSPRIHIYAGKASYLEIFSRKMARNASGYWQNEVIDCVLDERASLHLTSLQKKEGKKWDTQAIRGSLKKESQFSFLSFTNDTLRQDLRLSLVGPSSEANLRGVWLLNEREEAHVNVLVKHEAPYTRSLQKFKGVLDGASRSHFEGKIWVAENAMKTEAFQTNHNLILSERAQSLSKPNLEIFADDVKASHGATCGEIDKNLLFYLQTRGMTTDLAKKLLIYGFSREIIDLIKQPSLKKEVTLLASEVFFK